MKYFIFKIKFYLFLKNKKRNAKKGRFIY